MTNASFSPCYRLSVEAELARVKAAKQEVRDTSTLRVVLCANTNLIAALSATLNLAQATFILSR